MAWGLLQLNFSDEGAQVIVTDLNQDKINEVVEDILSHGKKCFGIKLDVTNSDEIKSTVDEVVIGLGVLIFLLIMLEFLFLQITSDDNYEEYWDNTFNVLLKAQVQLIREALPYIQKSESGRQLPSIY